MPVTRHGKKEDVWWTYSFSPIDDESNPGGVGGVLVVCNDVTERHPMMDALRSNEERLQLALEAGGWGFGIGIFRKIGFLPISVSPGCTA